MKKEDYATYELMVRTVGYSDEEETNIVVEKRVGEDDEPVIYFNKERNDRITNLFSIGYSELLMALDLLDIGND